MGGAPLNTGGMQLLKELVDNTNHTTKYQRKRREQWRNNADLRSMRKVMDKPDYYNEKGKKRIPDREKVRRWRSEKRKEKKQRNDTESLIQIAKYEARKIRYYSTTLLCEGKALTNRDEWLQEALRFGQRRFQDPSNGKPEQRERIEELRDAIQQHEKDDGRQSNISHWDLLQSRARMKLNKAIPPAARTAVSIGCEESVYPRRALAFHTVGRSRIFLCVSEKLAIFGTPLDPDSAHLGSIVGAVYGLGDLTCEVLGHLHE